MESLNKIAGFIETYKGSLENNHIIDEIRSYDKKIKDFDKAYVDNDNKLFEQMAKSTAHDDHHNDDELELLFSQ